MLDLSRIGKYDELSHFLMLNQTLLELHLICLVIQLRCTVTWMMVSDDLRAETKAKRQVRTSLKSPDGGPTFFRLKQKIGFSLLSALIIYSGCHLDIFFHVAALKLDAFSGSGRVQS